MRAEFYPRFKSGRQLMIEGYNQNRLLNELVKEGVTVYEAQRVSPRQLRVKITSQSLPKTFAILEKFCYNYTVEKKLGLPAMAAARVTRLGVIAGLIAVIALYALSYGFIWRVKIDGNAKVDTLTITRALNEQGIKTGTSKAAIDCLEVESLLRKLDGIAEASCVKKGTTLHISVMESLDYVPRPSDDNRVILSAYDAEVTRYTVRSGTAAVKVGQRVAKGGVLISGDVLGTEGQVISSVRADGDVYGKVVFSERVAVAKNGLRLKPTGAKKKSTVLRLFGLNIGKPFGGYEYSRAVYSHSRLSPLPIEVTSVVTEELAAESYELTDEQARERAEYEARERLNERLVGQPIDEELIIKDLGGGIISAELYVTVEMNIGAL